MDTRTAQSATAHRTQRNLRGWRWGVVGLAAVLAAGGAVGASAQPTGVPTAIAPGIGTLPPKPSEASDLAAIIRGAAGAPKAKLGFALPLQVQRVYAGVGTPIIKDGYLTTYNEAFVVTNPGPDPSFGVFPDTTKTILGFGALPVTATIHLTQTTNSTTGALDPIKITNVALSDVPFSSDTTVVGTVLVRVSDVMVDQVPLDVGPNCVGSEPVNLKLTGHDDGGHHLPTDYNPFVGGPLAGTFTLPSFAGCGSGGQDLDPLLTGTVSGPGNTIVLNQSALGDWDPTAPNDCRVSGRPKPCPTPVQPSLPTPAPTGG